MELIEAIELVLELARANVCDKTENQEEYARQIEAANMLEDFALNYLAE